MNVGVHLRNHWRLEDEDRDNIGRARVNSGLVMWYQSPIQPIDFGLSPNKSIVRLQDSVYRRWPSGEKYIPSWMDYARDLTDTIEYFYEQGYRRFQVDCEPDLSWVDAGYQPPPGHTIEGDWLWFMSNALFDYQWGVRYMIPEDVQLGLTPLACPIPEAWATAIASHIMDDGRRFVKAFDFAAAHCYWQQIEDMYNPMFGRNYLDVLLMTDYALDVYITECGCSSQAPDVEQRRIYGYPLYGIMARDDYMASDKVKGVYFFILGSDGWPTFELSPEVCMAIGRRGPDDRRGRTRRVTNNRQAI